MAKSGKNKGDILDMLKRDFEPNNENDQEKCFKVPFERIEEVVRYYAGVEKENMDIVFAWVKWFGELVTTISSENQDTLSVKINQAIKDKGQSIIKFEAYDPFSFFYFLAQKNTRHQKKLFFQSVDRVFNVNASLPNFDNNDCWVFPTPHTNVLYKRDNKYEPELLWDFFQQIISIKNVDELATKVTNHEFIDDFKMVLDLKSVGVPKLTQTLFLINPNVFFTIDWILKPISHKLLDNPNTNTEKNIKQLINSETFA